MIEAEELRVDRTPKRRRGKPYRTLDQKLTAVEDTIELRTVFDLLALLPIAELPVPFDTQELSAALGRPRWLAQKIAYCLRCTGAAKVDGKRGHAQLYRVRRSYKRRAA
ncbi:MAG: hypothetical protein R3C53_27235 [Pirellulaceae bacterium]